VQVLGPRRVNGEQRNFRRLCGTGRRAILFAVSLVLIAGTYAPATSVLAETSPPYDALYLYGEPAGWPVRDRMAAELPPDWTFSVTTSTDTSQASFKVSYGSWWDLRFAAPEGDVLAVGTYEGARLLNNRLPTEPGFQIGSSQAPCSSMVGDFTVLEIDRDAGGVITSFAATFVESCSDLSPGNRMFGDIRYHSQVPWAGWELATDPLDYDPTLVGASSLEQAFVVSNRGVLPVAISASIIGSNAPDFEITTACPTSLSAGSSCNIGVTFTPSDRGTRTASVQVSSDVYGASGRVDLAGTGLTPTTTILAQQGAARYPLPVTLSAEVVPHQLGTFYLSDGPLSAASTFSQTGIGSLNVVLAPGSHDLTSTYGGWAGFASSTSDPITVDDEVLTLTRLEISPASAQVGQTVQLYASVATIGSYQLSGGTLSIIDADSGDILAETAVTRAAPELRVAMRFFDPGSRHLTARYSGHEMLGSSEDTELLQVAKVATVTKLTPSTTTYPDPVELKATVNPVPAGGSVDFSADGSSLGTALVDRATGEASLRVSLSPGTRTVVASFSGTESFGPSSAPAVTERVVIATAVDATIDPNPAKANGLVTISAVVRGIGAPAPSAGQLVITDLPDTFIASTPVTTATKGIATTLQFSEGTHQIRVTYVGAGDYDGSETTSGLVVGPPDPDSVPPAGALLINGGASFTNERVVALALSASDPSPGSGVAAMSFSETGTAGSWTAWQPYATTSSWTFAGPDGSRHLYVRYRDAAENISVPASAGIVLDTTPPVPAPPDESFAVGSVVARRTLPVTVAYGTVDATSNVTGYDVAISADGGATYKLISSSRPADYLTRALSPGTTQYRFRVRSTDAAGNANQWTSGQAFILRELQEQAPAIAYAGKWSTKRKSHALGGAMRVSSTAGATATLTFTGRGIALVVRTGPMAGKAEVYIDGQATIIDLYAPVKGWRQIAFGAELASGQHTIQVRCLGLKRPASTGTQVAIDAFLVIQ
jgi:hypothetical protein